MLFNALEKFELGFCADEIMLRIFDLVVCITVYVVCKEAYALNIWEESCRIGQVLDFGREQE